MRKGCLLGSKLWQVLKCARDLRGDRCLPFGWWIAGQKCRKVLAIFFFYPTRPLTREDNLVNAHSTLTHFFLFGTDLSIRF
jgi:hypothetical protein